MAKQNPFPILMANPDDVRNLSDSERLEMDSIFPEGVDPEDADSFRSRMESIGRVPSRQAALSCAFENLLKIGHDYKRCSLHCETPSYGRIADRLDSISQAAKALGNAIAQADPWVFARIANLQSTRPKDEAEYKALLSDAKRGERFVTLDGTPALHQLRIQLLALYGLASHAAADTRFMASVTPGAKSIAEVNPTSGAFPSMKDARLELFQACLRVLSESGQDPKEAEEIARAIHAWAVGELPPPEWGKREWEIARKIHRTQPQKNRPHNKK